MAIGGTTASGKSGMSKRCSFRRIISRAIEVLLAVDLVALMSTALIEEAAHEWLGVALFVLAIAHICFRWRGIRAVIRGRASALKAVQLSVYALILFCLFALVVSSLVISKFAFGWLPALPGASWARGWHMVSSYWVFAFSFLHVGLSARIFPKSKRNKPRLIAWLACCLLSLVLSGIAFIDLNMWSHMTLEVQFAFADMETPLWLTGIKYVLVALGFATLGNLIRMITTAFQH